MRAVGVCPAPWGGPVPIPVPVAPAMPSPVVLLLLVALLPPSPPPVRAAAATESENESGNRGVRVETIVSTGGTGNRGGRGEGGGVPAVRGAGGRWGHGGASSVPGRRGEDGGRGVPAVRRTGGAGGAPRASSVPGEGETEAAPRVPVVRRRRTGEPGNEWGAAEGSVCTGPGGAGGGTEHRGVAVIRGNWGWGAPGGHRRCRGCAHREDRPGVPLRSRNPRGTGIWGGVLGPFGARGVPSPSPFVPPSPICRWPPPRAAWSVRRWGTRCTSTTPCVRGGAGRRNTSALREGGGGGCGAAVGRSWERSGPGIGSCERAAPGPGGVELGPA